MNNEQLNQLIGFFMGEGAVKIGIQTTTKGRKDGRLPSTHLSLAIGLRGDDIEILHSFRELVGGAIYEYDCPTPTGKISTQARWSLGKREDVYSFLLLVRENCHLPFKKMRDIEVGITWCEWRNQQPHHGIHFDPSYGHQLREELMSLHKFDYR